MNKEPYLYNKEFSTRYRFFSIGKKPVEKIVEFTPLAIENIFNLGFGDLLPDGSIDDKANSNNGDIIKVLSTIIYIIKDFTEENPELKIVFRGSTKERTALYQRIIKTHLDTFRKEFLITALEGPANSPKETPFDTEYTESYLAFFVKRKT
jgi:hypothetical protein